MTVVLIVVAVVVVAAGVVAWLRNRSANSSVDSFRRHIDALGPEARRTVVDQVQSVAGRDVPESTPDPAGEAGTGDAPEGDAGEDGPRGT